MYIIKWCVLIYGKVIGFFVGEWIWACRYLGSILVVFI